MLINIIHLKFGLKSLEEIKPQNANLYKKKKKSVKTSS